MTDAPLLTTPLHAWHQAHGARLVEFGGWSMPVQYSSIVEEHTAVRERVGLFDISHMGRLRFEGAEALDWLNSATSNDVSRLKPEEVQYSLILNENGGIVDDVLVYRLPDDDYRVVCNASNRAVVLSHFERHAPLHAHGPLNETFSSAMIAVQGPLSGAALQAIGTTRTPLERLAYYQSTPGWVGDVEILVSRTGYTGEDGYELIVPSDFAESTWTALLDAGRDLGIRPIGLGARDTLRFEAAMPLYGHELSEAINPYEAGLGWAVKLEKGEFVGREALRQAREDRARARIGLELEGKRIARQGCPVKRDGRVVGEVTSGTFSPTLGKSLAMALVGREAGELGGALTVDVRGRDEPARVVPLPFYRRPGAGKPAPAGPSPVGA